MANNRSPITTVPLAAKLNMNENQEIISNTYDQLNKQNASLYGGMLSPVWSRTNSSLTKQIFDKHGIGYKYSNSYYNITNSEEKTVLSGGSGYFLDFDLSNAPYSFDQAEIVYSDISYSEITYRIIGAVKNKNSIKLYFYNVVCTVDYYDLSKKTVSWSLLDSKTLNTDYIMQMRLKYYQDYDKLDVFFVTTEDQDRSSMVDTRYYLADDFPYKLSIYTFKIYDTELALLGYDEKKFQFNTWGSYDNCSAPSYGNGTSSSFSSNTDIIPQITISSKLRTVELFNIDTGLPTHTYGASRGVTIYNHRQDGTNGIADMRACNFVLLSDVDRQTTIVAANLMVMPGPRFIRRVFDKLQTATVSYKNGGGGAALETVTTITGQYYSRDGSGDSVQMGCGWGTFVDDSPLVMMATSWTEHTESNGSTASDYAPVVVDGSKAVFYIAAPENVNRTLMYVDRMVDSDEPAFGAALSYVGNALPGNLEFILPTLVTNQRHHRFIMSGINKFEQKKYGYWCQFMIDNMTGCHVKYYAGSQSTSTLPDSDEKSWNSTSADDNSLWYRRYNNKIRVYNQAGKAVNIGNGFRVLYNYSKGYVSGISYDPAMGDNIGTLLTKWDSIDDSFYIENYGRSVIYKDSTTKGLKIIQMVRRLSDNLGIDHMNRLQIVADRYLIWNTTAYENCYDIETGKTGHWASDWNNRIIGGVEMGEPKGACNSDNGWNDFVETGEYHPVNGRGPNYTIYRYNYYFKTNTYKELLARVYNSSFSMGSGVDIAYQATKTFAPSRLIPYVSFNKYATGYEVPYYCTTTDGHLLDYFGSAGTSAPSYKVSFLNGLDNGWNTQKTSGALIGTTYPTSSSGTAYYNFPIIGVRFVQSYSGKFGALIGNQGYSIMYDGIRPVALYNSTSMVDNVYEFFIVQSQYYAIINNYICAVSYSSSNILNGIEQIVNINGMQFLAAFPSCAYFYSPASRSIYAFTGDADLQLFVQTDRITDIYLSMFAPNNEWIYMWTNDGLYIMTQQNVLRLESIEGAASLSKPYKMFATDQDYNIIEDEDGNSTRIAMYRADTGYQSNKVILETEYFGPGEMRTEIIDTWYIRFRKPTTYEDNLSVKIWSRNLNGNTLSETEHVELRITKDMWDGNGCYLYRYQPEIQNSEGQSLHIESEYPIMYLGFSHQGDTSVLTLKAEHNEITPLVI